MIDRRLLLALIGCAVCAAIIAAELHSESYGFVENAADRSAKTSDKAVTQVRQIPAQQLIAVARARPLVSPTRRPPEKGKAVGFDLGDKRLAGIVVTPGRRLAIFAVNGGGKPLVVNEGEAVNGWQIDKITTTAISLRGRGGTETLQPKLDQSLIGPSPALTSPVVPNRPPPGAARGPPPSARAEPHRGWTRAGHDQ